MHKDYNMTQLTLPKETSVHIPTHDMSQYVNDIVKNSRYWIHTALLRNIIASQYDVESSVICLHTISIFW